ncbi:DUF3365 domain-containing protein [Novosphingobium mangrovi (ex Huang et al. 2023)]|uniref:DUF3365 domain-containing protein n=1 Tax=Novosphingobium mangrovi (ex Huang et al. 2023) TaxID=2976432 RepID=A0ABT2HZR8_9SPHN|nr:DUF3365 domain-containing protein [Novosphingobium mangrovi (ex Huang et al. 2023)]MCT2398041.1 DUF3365 domain-containing protein [Novosphingobium mangrovi (ex Huang et al. 2023)]
MHGAGRGTGRAWLAAAALTTLCAACAQEEPPLDEAAVLARSDAVAGRFQSTLQGQLKTALAAGGPMLAVTVCHDAAPLIAAQESERSGALVSRVAERNRSPAGGLSDELRPHYTELASAPLVDGKPASRIWRTGTGDDATINVLRAIPMQEKPCTVCHGIDVSPDLAARIQELYPNDKATGFKPGDMRGAMLIRWPAAAFAE